MSYIDFINNFWQKDLEATFSHLEVHLFFKLLEVNNKLGWKNDFKYPNARLEGDLGTRPKNLIQARQRLIDFGVISYKKGTTRDAGIYRILSNERVTKESNKGSNEESNQESNKGNNKGSNTEVIREIIKGTLNRQDKDKTIKSTTNVVPKKSGKPIFSLDFISDENFKKLFEEWLDYRRAIKKPYKSQQSVEACFKQLQNLGGFRIETCRAVIEQSIANGYQGLFDLKTQSFNNQKTTVKNEQNKQSGAALGRVATSDQHRAISL